MTTFKELMELLEQDESLTLEFKDSGILSDSFKLAKTMTAFANAEGGRLLIGIKDDKNIEGMTARRGHEEHIMNIASDRCDPSLTPRFEKVIVPKKGAVYVVRVHRRQGPYHAVKTKNGYVFFRRVGSTIREIPPSELSLGEQGVEVPVGNILNQFWSWVGKKMLYRFYGGLNVNIIKFQIVLAVVSSLLILGSLFLIFGFEEGHVIVRSHPVWVNYLQIIGLVTGWLGLHWFSYIPKTKCPNCGSYFSFHIVKEWVFDKRRVKEGLEEWKIRDLKACDECNHEELGKLRYKDVEV
jgi:hypothetical protein